MPHPEKTTVHPGPLPEIHADGGDLLYTFALSGRSPETRLVLRYDEQGELWARLVPAADNNDGWCESDPRC